MTPTEWCKYLGVANVVEGVNKGSRAISHMFGFETGKGNGEVEDRHAGSVDAMYLGVVPKRLHDSIGRYFRGVLGYGRTSGEAQSMVAHAEQLWTEAREIAKARVVGLHRLFATVTRGQKEKMADESGVTLKRKPKPDKTEAGDERVAKATNGWNDEKERNETEREESEEVQRELSETEARRSSTGQREEEMRDCPGPQCVKARKDTLGKGRRKFMKYKVRTGRSYCHRCARHRRAEKRCREALEAFQGQAGGKTKGIPAMLEAQKGKPVSLQRAIPVLAGVLPERLWEQIQTRKGERKYTDEMKLMARLNLNALGWLTDQRSVEEEESISEIRARWHGALRRCVSGEEMAASRKRLLDRLDQKEEAVPICALCCRLVPARTGADEAERSRERSEKCAFCAKRLRPAWGLHASDGNEEKLPLCYDCAAHAAATQWLHAAAEGRSRGAGSDGQAEEAESRWLSEVNLFHISSALLLSVQHF